MSDGINVVACLAFLADDPELPARARDLLALVLFHNAVRVERILYPDLRALYAAAIACRCGASVDCVERAATTILRAAAPSLVVGRIGAHVRAD